jgi:Ca2+-binding RTX toxin-like protein
VKTPRRAFALLVGLAALGLPASLGAAPAGAATCSLNTSTHVLTAHVSSGSGIELDKSHVQVTGCTSVAATAVDTVNITGTAGPDQFWLFASLPLPAGTTVEGSGISEVEVHIDLDGGSDVIEWQSAEATTDVTAKTAGFDLNGDGDADILPAHVETFRLRTGPGDDSFDASAGIPAGITDVDVEDGPGHDTFVGGAERDTLNPWDGHDTFRGGPGKDVVEVMGLDPTSSFDLGSYQGDGGLDTIVFDSPVVADLGSGTAQEPASAVKMHFSGFENLTGLGGNDTLTGDVGPNVLEGIPGDTLRGLGGDDTLIGRNGGAWADYGDASGVTVNLSTGTATGDGIDTLVGIDDVIGSPGNDSIVGADDAPGVLRGTAGNDTIRAGSIGGVLEGGPGNDDLRGGDGPDDLHGGAGDDVMLGGPGADGFSGGSGTDRIDGGAGADGWSVVLRSSGAHSDEPATEGVVVNLASGVVADDGHGDTDSITSVEKAFGSPFADRLTGSAADNVLSGGGGNDRFVPGSGDDVVEGGGGRDTVSFASAMKPIHLDLTARTASGQGQDLLTRIEVALGSPYDDRLAGSPADERLDGGGGNDTVLGRRGHDALLGGPGADHLDGGDGIDTCNGGGGSSDTATACETVWRVP